MCRRSFLVSWVTAALFMPAVTGSPLRAGEGSTATVATAAAASMSAAKVDPIVTPEMRKQLRAYFDDVCDWIMTLDVGSGTLKNTKDTATSVFINGNFARVLMASYRMTGNRKHLDEALRWCDTLLTKQQQVETSTGAVGGFWPDCGPTGNIYFGDAGTAATALAIGYRLAPKERRAGYLAAMQRKFRFVTQGCKKDPQNKGRKVCDGWVIEQGPDKGALGCGYYRGKLSTEPYTISTATTGGAFFSELHAITKDPAPKAVATGAVRWLLKIRKPDGEIPYTLAGKTLDTWPLDTMSYCTEAFVAADKHLGDEKLSKLMARELEPSVQWLVKGQNADGSWGKLRSADQQRSPRCLTLLTWYYNDVKPDAKVAQAVRKYCGYLLVPANSKAYGVKSLVRTTGFVGLAIAEVLEPGSTF